MPQNFSSEDTQQFSAAEVAQLKRYAKRAQPTQPKAPTTTNRVHLAIVIAVALAVLAALALAAWYMYLSITPGGTSSESPIANTKAAPIASTHQSDVPFGVVVEDGILRTAAITSHR